MDRTCHRRPSRAEVNKARRLGRTLTARDELRRQVRAAAVAAANEEEFFARLADAGVMVSKRPSHQPGRVDRLQGRPPGHTTAGGEPLWFSGG